MTKDGRTHHGDDQWEAELTIVTAANGLERYT